MRRLIPFFISLMVTGILSAQQIPLFTQEGIASWYGAEFDGRPTASGERFDSRGFTAAHPALPFGTMLKITNKHNNKQVIVRVNDRGPFVSARILDLSRGAAEVLDMIQTGTAPILVEEVRGDLVQPAPQTAPQAAPVPQVLPAPQPAPLPAAPVPAAPLPAVAPSVTPQTAAQTAAQTAPQNSPQVAVVAVPQAGSAFQGGGPVMVITVPQGTSVPVTAQATPVMVVAIPTESLAKPEPARGEAVRSAPAPAPSAAPPPEQTIPPVQAAAAPAPRPQPAVAPTVIKGGLPPAESNKVYRLQVGAYKVPRFAVDAFERLKKVGLNPRYEKKDDIYRVVLPGVPSADLPMTAQKIAEAGFREAILREEN